MHTTLLSCDWGTSSFRLRLIDTASGKAVAESTSNEGIKQVHASWLKLKQEEAKRAGFYFSIILKHIKAIKKKVKVIESGIPIIVSGMASANIGMIELPYTVLPFSLDTAGMEIRKITEDDFYGFELQLVSGARTQTDVMRGEETQLIGCADAATGASELFIFPGTHSKHVVVDAGKATDLKTYMTGEIFKLLTEHSVLASSIDTDGNEADENAAAFEQGVKIGAAQNLLHSLFRVRTNQLMRRISTGANYHYLSGLLIGAELADVKKLPPLKLTLVGEEGLIANYLEALKVLAISNKVTSVDAGLATIQGHMKIYKRLYT